MDWSSIGISAGTAFVITTLGSFVIKRYLSNTIDAHFNEKLENYKHQLNSLTESARFDYQRKLKDFDIYTNKKHTSYVEFNNLLLTAHGRVTGLMGLRSMPTYQEYNEEDIRKLLEKEHIPDGMRKDILLLFESNRDSAIEKIRELLRRIELHDAKQSRQDALNCLLLSKLYFSDKVFEKSKALLLKLGELYLSYEWVIEGRNLPTEDAGKEQERIDEINTLLDDVIALMKNELSVGYYSNT